MYRTCIASLCSTYCCDYYAYCVYPNQTPYCYTQATYYYYDYWWVWTLCSIVFVCLIISAAVGVNRRRRMMRRRQEEILITNNSMNNGPGIVQGQPVYQNNMNRPVMGSPGPGVYVVNWVWFICVSDLFLRFFNDFYNMK